MSSNSMDSCVDSSMDSCVDSSMKSPSEFNNENSCINLPEDNTDQDSKKNSDLDISSIWQCMKRINANLDYLSQKFNDVPSEKVPSEKVPSEKVPSEKVPSEKVPSKKVPSSTSTLDDDHFLLKFPLKEIEDVIELESRLGNDSSDFMQKFISYITPVDTGHVLDLKHFVRTMLRTLFTYGLAGNYSWRGFRGNFQIENLKTIELIFDISKKKFKNASKPNVNMFIKEWIRYAKQRRHQLKKN